MIKARGGLRNENWDNFIHVLIFSGRLLSDVLILGLTAGSICAEIGGFGLAPMVGEEVGLGQ